MSTFPLPGSRAKQATPPAAAQAFQRRAADLDGASYGISSSVFSVLTLAQAAADGTAITFRVSPNVGGVNTYAFAHVGTGLAGIRAGDSFLAMGAKGGGTARGVISSVTITADATTYDVEVVLSDFVTALGTAVEIGSWFIKCTTVPRKIAVDRVGFAGETTYTWNLPKVWQAATLRWLDIVHNAAAVRVLILRANADAVAANYRIGLASFDTAAIAVGATANLIYPANLAVAGTTSGWCTIQNPFTDGIIPVQSFYRTSGAQMRSTIGHYVGTYITSLTLSWDVGGTQFSTGEAELTLH